ncbi:MAG: shikimate kinase [Treponema sp.]|jgi:shikimate kinase|nr:shikimate kinase [Treponema sp.]
MKTVLLTGPKHAGKTSAGRALAVLVSGSFVDLDEHICARAGKSPRVLYTEGPGIFRKAEAAALADLLNRENGTSGAPAVIAAGGGIIDNPDALALCKKAGALAVYLEVSAETAWERIRRAAEREGLPPFLQTPNPQETHRVLHERRAAAYRAWACFTVPGEGKSPEEIAGEIYGVLQGILMTAQS